MIDEEEPLYEKVEGTEGKVLKLTRFTKDTRKCIMDTM